MVTGFYVAALSKYGNEELGHKYLKSIGHANYMDKKGDEWGFYEYHHGLKKTPEGTRGVAWNAAGHVIGYKTRRDGEVFKQESV